MIKPPRFVGTPENNFRDNELVPFLEEKGWMVEKMHGNAFQKGIPDLYCWHPGLQEHRWIDAKLPKGSVLTKAQCQKWPKWERHGLGVWIMKYATEEEYAKLWLPPNWREMWRPSYDKYVADVNEILDELDDDE